MHLILVLNVSRVVCDEYLSFLCCKNSRRVACHNCNEIFMFIAFFIDRMIGKGQPDEVRSTLVRYD